MIQDRGASPSPKPSAEPTPSSTARARQAPHPPSSMSRESQKANDRDLHPKWGAPVLSGPRPNAVWSSGQDVDGVRGCAQCSTSLAGGTKRGQGCSDTGMLTPTAMLCHEALPSTLPCFVCPSFPSPSLCPTGSVPGGSGTQLELGAGAAPSHGAVGGGLLSSGDMGPNPRWEQVPSSSPGG